MRSELRLALAVAGVWLGAAGAAAQPPAHVERVDVRRVVIDVHVLADDGRPVQGLTAGDFRVTVDGREVPVQAARWTTGAVADRLAETAAAPGAAGDPYAAPRGRQIVVLLQKDFEPTRLEGLMALLRRARDFIAGLPPDDLVAVVTFDWRLSVWSDFTNDRAAIDRILERDVLKGQPPARVAWAFPALSPHVDPAQARRAASMEQALLVMARALERVPGRKDLVILGHGFGRLGLPGLGGLPTSISFDAEYGPARDRFLAGRTAVYCLDTTRAAAHSLEAGLQQVAADTGGFFLRTHEFPGAALRRLGDALTGRYEVSVEPPPLPPGEHRLRVTVAGRKGLVLHRRSYVG